MERRELELEPQFYSSIRMKFCWQFSKGKENHKDAFGGHFQTYLLDYLDLS